MFLAELLAEIILNIGLEYIYPLICYRIKKLLSHQAGGTQQHINKQNIENLLILSLAEDVLKEYTKLVNALLEYISKTCQESENLKGTSRFPFAQTNVW